MAGYPARWYTEMAMSTPPVDLAGLDRAEIEALVESLGSPRFHARQIYQWIWKRGVTDIAGGTDARGRRSGRQAEARG